MKTTNISNNSNIRFSGKKIFNAILVLAITFAIPILSYLQVGYPVQKDKSDNISPAVVNTAKQNLLQQDKSVAENEPALFK